MDADEQPGAPATLLSYEEVRPQSFQGRRKSTRVQEYRRKLRKRRNRRIVVTTVSIATAVSLGLAYKIMHPEFTFQHFVPVEDLNVTYLDQLLDTAANQTQSVVKKLTGNGTSEAGPKEEKSRRRKQKAEKKMEIPTIEEERNLDSPDPSPTPIEKEKLIQVEVVKHEEVYAVALPKKERRPILCNIPLAYLIPRCWRLAREKPLFNLHNLVQDMMQ